MIQHSNITFSFIIVNFNTRELTKAAVDSIYKFENPDQLEVIVVDNNSTDGSVEFLAQNFPYITIIKNDKNVGFGVANNYAVNIARGRWIIFMNSDTYLTEPLTERLLQTIYTINSSPTSIIIAPQIFFPDNKIQVNYGNFPSLFSVFLESILFYRTKASKNLQKNSYFFSVDWVSGAFFLIEKDLFKSIGMFNSSIFMYGEDVEFCFRARKKGVNCFIDESSKIFHHLAGSSSPKSPFLLKISDIGRIKSFELMYGWVQSKMLQLILLARSILRIPFYFVLSIFSPKFKNDIILHWHGVYNLLGKN